MRDRSGVKILPPNENSHSTDALEGSPVFRVTYSFFMYGYSFRLSSPAAPSRKNLSTSWPGSSVGLWVCSLCCAGRFALSKAKKSSSSAVVETLVKVAEPEPDSEAAAVDAWGWALDAICYSRACSAATRFFNNEIILYFQFGHQANPTWTAG